MSTPEHEARIRAIYDKYPVLKDITLADQGVSGILSYYWANESVSMEEAVNSIILLIFRKYMMYSNGTHAALQASSLAVRDEIMKRVGELSVDGIIGFQNQKLDIDRITQDAMERDRIAYFTGVHSVNFPYDSPKRPPSYLDEVGPFPSIDPQEVKELRKKIPVIQPEWPTPLPLLKDDTTGLNIRTGKKREKPTDDEHTK